MIKEEFVSDEVAKLLQKKGFDEKCLVYICVHKNKTFYNFTGNFVTSEDLEPRASDKDCEYYLCPTQAMALAWLREKGYEISVSVGFTFIDGKQILKYFWDPIKVCKDHLEYPMDNSETGIFDQGTADSYVDAVNEGLKYVLERLI